MLSILPGGASVTRVSNVISSPLSRLEGPASSWSEELLAPVIIVIGGKPRGILWYYVGLYYGGFPKFIKAFPKIPPNY